MTPSVSVCFNTGFSEHVTFLSASFVSPRSLGLTYIRLWPFRLADLTGIQIGQATSRIYKDAFGERTYQTNLNDLLLEDNRYGK